MRLRSAWWSMSPGRRMKDRWGRRPARSGCKTRPRRRELRSKLPTRTEGRFALLAVWSTASLPDPADQLGQGATDRAELEADLMLPGCHAHGAEEDVGSLDGGGRSVDLGGPPRVPHVVEDHPSACRTVGRDANDGVAASADAGDSGRTRGCH